jgi:hypothetical protein
LEIFFFRLCQFDTYFNLFSLQGKIAFAVADVQEMSQTKNSNVWIVPALYLKRRVSTKIQQEKEAKGTAVVVPPNMLEKMDQRVRLPSQNGKKKKAKARTKATWMGFGQIQNKKGKEPKPKKGRSRIWQENSFFIVSYCLL